MSASPNGSEFALRIALSDLLERLRRSEEMCKYLERCRNEMARELIRVKQENELLTHEKYLLVASLDSANNCNGNVDGMTGGHVIHTVPQYSHRTDASSPRNSSPSTSLKGRSCTSCTDQDDNWEEISHRLLREMRQEVLKSSNNFRGKPRQSSSLPQTLDFIQQENVTAAADVDEPVTAIGNNSVGSVLLVGSQPKDHHLHLRNSYPHASSATLMAESKSTQEEGRAESDNIMSSKNCLKKDDDALPSKVDVVSNRETAIAPTKNVVVNSSSIPIDEVYVRILRELTNDMNQATQQILTQREKLTRMRTKQLRNFFRRQLTEESTPSSTGGPSVTQTSTHFFPMAIGTQLSSARSQSALKPSHRNSRQQQLATQK